MLLTRKFNDIVLFWLLLQGACPGPGNAQSACKCGPGHYLVPPCTDSDQVICKPCTEDTFNLEWDSSEECSECTACKAGQNVTRPCVKDEHDTQCSGCPENAIAWQYNCVCKKNYKAVFFNKDHFRCEPCPEGFETSGASLAETCNISPMENLGPNPVVSTTVKSTHSPDEVSAQGEEKNVTGVTLRYSSSRENENHSWIWKMIPAVAIPIVLSVGLVIFIFFIITKRNKKTDEPTDTKEEAPKDPLLPPFTVSADAPVEIRVDRQVSQLVVTIQAPSGRACALDTNKNYAYEKVSRIISNTRTLLQQRQDRPPGLPVWIAIIDSGANFRHPYLKKWEGRAVKINVLDPKEPENVEDRFGHGTFVLGVFTMMYEELSEAVKFVIIKAIDDEGNLNEESLSKASDVLSDKNYDHVSIVCLAGGFPDHPSDSLQRRINHLKSKKVLICAASNNGAWNNNNIAYPAREAIAIGSVNQYGNRSEFSPTGPFLFMMAPGENVLSWNAKFTANKKDTYAIEDSGTSFSTAWFSALTGLIFIQLPIRISETNFDTVVNGFQVNGQDEKISFTDLVKTKLMNTQGMKTFFEQYAMCRPATPEKGYGYPDLGFFQTQESFVSGVQRAIGITEQAVIT